MRARFFLIAAVLIVIIATLGCGGGGGTGTTITPVQGGQTAVQVSPNSVDVRLGTTQQFNAIVTGTSNQGVTWAVNSIAGGNAANGTISATGLYTPPATIPAGTISVTATSTQTTTASGTSTVRLLNPVPVIVSVLVTQVAPGTYTLSIMGSGFITGTQISVDGQLFNVTVNSSTQAIATVTVSAGQTLSSTISAANPAPGATNSNSVTVNVTNAAIDANLTAAARFLDQATFGYTRGDVQRVAQIGMNAWIDEQFAVAPSPWPNIPTDAVRSDGSIGFPQHCQNAGLTCAQMVFYQNALAGPDQLRQRVAWALQQIWVISAVTVNRGDAHMYYLRTMNSVALDNYLTVMRRVTLSPSMGWFQDTANNDGTDSTLPNENYARELLQLFTIGTVMLNDDGTVQVDGLGQPIPTYQESVVQNYARVNTGWTFRARAGVTQIWNQRANNNVDWNADLISIEAQHDRGAKTVLGGAVLPANQDAPAELDQGLGIIFNHTNVPPFVSRMLIQRLVTSNPSSQYIARVSAVFRDNGAGVRGDMRAIVKAILLDPEARRGDSSTVPSTALNDGKLKEPLLYVTGIMRGLNAAPTSAAPAIPSNTNVFALALAGPGSAPPYAAAMGENVLFSPTVFNFYSPDHVIPGTALYGPEFQIHTTATANMRANFVDAVVRNSIGGGTTVSAAITGYAAFSGAPAHLVERLNQDFMRGQMAAATRARIITAVSAIPAASTTARARTAIYLVVTSPHYQALP